MNDKNVKPQLRLAGFTDDWEQRKLGEICDFINGDRSSNYPSASDFQENGIPFIGSDSLGATLIDKNKMRFITQEKYSHMNGIKIQNEDILYTLRGAGFGKCSITDFSEGTVASSLVGIRCKRDILAPKFLVQWFSSSDAECEKQKAVNGSTAQNISVEDMKAYSLKLPKINEQEKIYEYLFSIDNLITLHQRKYEALQKLKKSMLQKMFPQKGSLYPEVRFVGFTDAWEQREFGNIAQRLSETAVSCDELPYIEYEDVISNQGILNKDVSAKEGEKTGIIFSEENVLYGKLRPYLHNWLNPDFKGVAVGDWWVLKPINADKNFLYRLIQSDNFDNVANQSTGTKMPRADWKLVSATEFCLPKSLEEQAKIGHYFTDLDNLITFHQRKLEKLKNIKKACLEKMFV